MRFDIDSIYSAPNPLGLVFWQGGGEGRGG